MARYGSGSVPIATGWKCTNCRRTHRSSIPRSASGNTRARPALTTDTSRPPRNWSAPCPGSSERCNTILSQSDPICFLFADRYVPLIMRDCIGRRAMSLPHGWSASNPPTSASDQCCQRYWIRSRLAALPGQRYTPPKRRSEKCRQAPRAKLGRPSLKSFENSSRLHDRFLPCLHPHGITVLHSRP